MLAIPKKHEHNRHRIETLFDLVGRPGTDQTLDALVGLLDILDGEFPKFVFENFAKIRPAHRRVSFIDQCTKFARNSHDALKLAKSALKDRSKEVRFSALATLAYSLDETVLIELNDALEAAGAAEKADIRAVIDAIECQNHNFFMDRDHSGLVTWSA